MRRSSVSCPVHKPLQTRVKMRASLRTGHETGTGPLAMQIGTCHRSCPAGLTRT
jgi:hypothetical protein